MGFDSRKSSSHENTQIDNPYGGDKLMDDTALLLAFLAKRCGICTRVIKIRFLETINGKDLCPDCR